MKIERLAVSDAMSIATLWSRGATESSLSDERFRPILSVQECSRLVEADLIFGTMFGWGAYSDDGSSSQLRAYLTVEIKEASEYYPQPGYLYVQDLDVDSNYRRRGIASELVEHAVEHCRASGLSCLQAGWIPSDPVANGFWSHLGFKPMFVRGALSI